MSSYEGCLCGALWTGKSLPYRHFQEEQIKNEASSRNSRNDDYHKGCSLECIPFLFHLEIFDRPRFLSARISRGVERQVSFLKSALNSNSETPLISFGIRQLWVSMVSKIDFKSSFNNSQWRGLSAIQEKNPARQLWPPSSCHGEK